MGALAEQTELLGEVLASGALPDLHENPLVHLCPTPDFAHGFLAGVTSTPRFGRGCSLEHRLRTRRRRRCCSGVTTWRTNSDSTRRPDNSPHRPSSSCPRLGLPTSPHPRPCP